MVKRKEAIVT